MKKLFEPTYYGSGSEDFSGPNIFPLLIGLIWIVNGIISCTIGVSNVPYENPSWPLAIFSWVVGGVFFIPALIDTIKK